MNLIIWGGTFGVCFSYQRNILHHCCSMTSGNFEKEEGGVGTNPIPNLFIVIQICGDEVWNSKILLDDLLTPYILLIMGSWDTVYKWWYSLITFRCTL